MTVTEAGEWIDLARRKGVVELHVADVRFLLGPLPAESPKQPMAKVEEEGTHPADLIANPPTITPDTEAA